MPIVIAVVLLIGSSVLGAAVGYPLLVPLVMVIATTVWVHSDSDEIDYPDSAIEAKVLLFWIVYFPFYLYRRRELKIANAVTARLSKEKASDLRMSNSMSPSISAATPCVSERACPECGETVLAVARKCKHCGSAIEPIVTDAAPATESSISSAQSAPAAASGPMGARLGRSTETSVEEVDGKSSRKIVFGVAAAVIALGAFLWFASNYNGPDPAVEALNSATQTAPNGAVGQPVTTPKFGILVTQVETPARVGNSLIQESPAEGGSYVAVQWEYRNNSSNPIGIFSQPTVHLEDPSGTRYDPDVGASSAYAMQLELTEKAISNLNPGIKVRAGAVFEIASAELELPGWVIVIDADRNVKMPLYGKPEPAAVARSEAPETEEAVVAEQMAGAEAAALPEFGAYEVAIYDGDLFAADWMTQSESGEWTDQIGKSMNTPDVNFAGKYFIGLHSCGTGCRYYTMTDLSTGRALDELIARFAAGEERPKTEDGLEYLTRLVGQADSRLLLAQYFIESPTEECREQSFVLEGESLRALSDVRKGCSQQ